MNGETGFLKRSLSLDKILHVGLGVICVIVSYLALYLFSIHGFGLALGFSTTMCGLLYEAQQAYRKEGSPDLIDALATALPGWFVYLILELI